MTIQFRGTRVGVEKSKKHDKSKKDSFIIVHEAEEYVGIIKYLGQDCGSNLSVGQKVYFTTDHQPMKIGGIEVCVMDEKQIVAVINEEVEQKA
jgi:co-chaperonin GroES (HSP10)